MAWGDNDAVVEDSGKWEETPAPPKESRAYSLVKALGRMGRSAVTQAAGLGGLANPPLAALGAAATYMRPGDNRSFGERYNAEAAALRGQQESSASENPTSAAVGGAVGFGQAAKALPLAAAPISALTESAPMAMRAIAGYADAVGLNKALALLRHTDDSQAADRAMTEAEQSPWNALGAAAPLASALPEASKYWRNVANRAKARVMAPGNAQAQQAFRDRFGSYEAAGEATRNVGGKDVARFGLSPDERAAELERIARQAGEKKGALTDALSEQGVSMNPTTMLDEVVARRNEMFGDPLTRAQTHPETQVSGTGLGKVAAEADAAIAEMKGIVEQGGSLPVNAWERIKTALNNANRRMTARGYPAGTPAEVIRSDPAAKFSDATANAIKRADEAAIAEQAPEAFPEFMRLKAEKSAAETFRGPARSLADVAQAGGSSHSLPYPTKHGVAYGLERALLSPARHLGIGAADALSAMTARPGSPMTPVLGATAMEQLIRALRENKE